MVALKLKETWNGYNQVSSEEEGRVALHDRDPPSYADDPNVRDEEGARLLGVDTELPSSRPRRKRKGTCCVCCGVDIGLFCKALGIVTLLFTIYGAVKLIIWAVSPDATGLEKMPAFSDSLGCQNAQYVYKGAAVSIKVPYGTRELDHVLDVRGKTPGTITLVEGSSEATDIEYTVTIRSTAESALEDVSFDHPSDATPETTRMLIKTPWVPEEDSSCSRYDIVMHIPPGLKKLAVSPHTLAHVQFKPKTGIDLDALHVTTYVSHENNMILPHQDVRAKKLFLEVFRGWIVGDISVGEQASITTQRGDGTANVRVHPMEPQNPTTPEPCGLQTTTGAGRTDISYVGDKRFPHRPIKATHMSSRNGDVYLTYREAEFSGRVALDSRSYTTTGLQSFPGNASGGDTNSGTKWTHWLGDKDGVDEIIVKSRGWTGLYL
ncbi:hypothetical protein AAF712_013977 [Marasmius tenuissimus]|uniref:Uncharacterized protein n=1 Tax=Marasmius tenuissimus TaxID=585030 RepID=A0ABR2ZE77_9AGAR